MRIVNVKFHKKYVSRNQFSKTLGSYIAVIQLNEPFTRLQWCYEMNRYSCHGRKRCDSCFGTVEVVQFSIMTSACLLGVTTIVTCPIFHGPGIQKTVLMHEAISWYIHSLYESQPSYTNSSSMRTKKTKF